MHDVRPPAVAGMFYPGDATTLSREVAMLLDAAPQASGECPRVLIVPHAGYVYSGAVAATAYARLRGHADAIDRVVLLGPAHRVTVRGMALPRSALFDTPLGRIEVDPLCKRLAELREVEFSDAAHELEHALEVQLPFLQQVLDGFRLLPVVVGGASAEAVAGLLDAAVDAGTLVVISSDLSHYHDNATARRLDADTAARIEAFSTHLQGEQACGAAPLNGMLLWARRRGLHMQRLALANSSDTIGPPDRVVGYGAWMLTQAAVH